MQQKKKKTSLLPLLKPYAGMIVVLLLLTLAGNAISLWLPRIISKSVDSFIAGHFDYGKLGIEFSICVALVFIFGYFQGLLQTYASEKVARDLRKSLAERISVESFAFIEEANPSKLLTNLTADVDSIKMYISQAVVSIVSSFFIIIGVSVMLVNMNWRLGLCVIVIIPIIGFTFFLTLRKVRAIFIKARAVMDSLNKVINESILGAALIRVLNSQAPEYLKFLDANKKAMGYGMEIRKLIAGLIPVISFTAGMAVLLVLGMGGHFVIVGSMSLGNFTAFNSYLAILIFPIIVIGFMSNVIAQASASYERIRSVLDKPLTPDSGSINLPLQGRIEARNVSLAYGQKPVLKHISFVIEPGTRTAIIGPTAAGKTQLLYVLTGLIPPGEGQVLFDDHQLASYRKEAFHRHLGLVFQDSIVFQLSIRENIAFNQQVTEAAMRLAVETAELSGYIDTLPEGLDTIVSERGSTLSGGQKQRIMLARALALQPTILLLDDFTARVDYETEKRIRHNVARNYPNLTLVSVTQQIAAAEDFDQIILLMEGEVIASGRHADLIQTSPEYAQLYQSQKSTSHYELQA